MATIEVKGEHEGHLVHLLMTQDNMAVCETCTRLLEWRDGAWRDVEVEKMPEGARSTYQ